LAKLLLEPCNIGCSWELRVCDSTNTSFCIKRQPAAAEARIGGLRRGVVCAFAQRFIPLSPRHRGLGRVRRTQPAFLQTSHNKIHFERGHKPSLDANDANCINHTAPITHETLETIKTQLAFKLTHRWERCWVGRSFLSGEKVFFSATVSSFCRILTHGARHLTPSQEKNSRLRVTGFWRTT